MTKWARCGLLLCCLALVGMPLTRPAHASAVVLTMAQEAGGSGSTPPENSPESKKEETDSNDEYRHSETVVKLGKMMGMNAEQAATAFTVFNFLVLAVAVGYGLLKFLPTTFRKRSSNIQRDLVDARTATEEATARLNSVEDRLSKLDGQIAEMRKQAEADLVRDEQKMKASAEEEKQKILAAAEQEIQAATAMARRGIQNFAAELAISQAARKLVVTAETDSLLVESFAHRLGAEKEGRN